MKQVIVIRTDLNLSPGKAVAQGSHAAVQAYADAPRVDQWRWSEQGQTKIVLAADSHAELFGLSCLAAEANLPWYLVKDSGRTEVEPGTVTALAIGPAVSTKIDAITGSLKLYK